jgi:hypothetical protein
MNFKDLLQKYKTDKSRVLINGLGGGQTKGTIIEVHDDYIVYELLQVEKEKKGKEATGKEKQTRELKYIPINAISDLSEGEKETESTGLTSFK